MVEEARANTTLQAAEWVEGVFGVDCRREWRIQSRRASYTDARRRSRSRAANLGTDDASALRLRHQAATK